MRIARHVTVCAVAILAVACTDAAPLPDGGITPPPATTPPSPPPPPAITPPSPPTTPPPSPPATPIAPAVVTDDGTGPRAMRAADFIDTIGVGAHFSRILDGNTIWSKQQVALRTKLLESGIPYIRTGQHPTMSSGGSYIRYLKSLNGVKINLITTWELDLTQLPRIGADLGAQLVTIESRNEPDLQSDWSDTETPAKLRDLQKTLADLRNTHDSLKNVKLLGPSIIYEKSARLVGDMSAHVDFLNAHMYTGSNHPEFVYRDAGVDGRGYGSVKSTKAMHAIMGGDKCLMVTESGEHNDYAQTTGHLGTTEKVSGRWIPRVYLELARRGVCRTFIYEFVDEWNQPTNIQANFGLLRNDLSEKPAFKAVKNMIALLKDSAAGGLSFTAGRLEYTLSGSTSNVSQMLFQKADGTFYLALWLGKSAWDQKTRTEVVVPNQSVTLTVPKRSSVAAHTLDDAGVMTHGGAQPITNGAVTVSLSDRVTFLELK